jgi:hypothetical protein
MHNKCLLVMTGLLALVASFWLLPVMSRSAAAVVIQAEPAATPVIKLGVMGIEAANDEFSKYNAFAADLRKEGVEASFINQNYFMSPKVSAEETYRALKRFHVIYLHQVEAGVPVLTPEMEQSATSKGEAIARYVSEGGGLLVAPSVVRYAGSDDQKYWNLLFKPLGLAGLGEGLIDKTRTLKARTEWLRDSEFWYTKNITPHPVTDGIGSLWFPYTADGPMPQRAGTAAVQYSPDWQVIVRGEKEAASCAMTVTGEYVLAPEIPGTFKTAPPVVAVRTLGKGRVVCYPVFSAHVIDQYGKKNWPHIVEKAGDGKIPGNGMKLVVNACKWLATPCLSDPQFGTFEVKPFEPTKWAESTTWPYGKIPTAPGTNAEVRGVVGAHTRYTDGEGTVADYVKAARAIGLSFLVFTDPLEKLTPEKLEALKKDCREASQDGSFFACPGIEFNDHMDNRWVLWGDKVNFPKATTTSGKKTFTQWDGQRINQYFNYISESCTWTRGSALVSYADLIKNGGHPEKLMWYFHAFPLAYEKDRLIADNTEVYWKTQRDLRRLDIAGFTRIHSPAELAAAAATITTHYPSLTYAKAGLTGTCSEGNPKGYVSQGPQILQWKLLGPQGRANWRYTRGTQRMVARLMAHSDDGIAEIKVHDADQGVFRRFDAKGAKDFAQDFELTMDKQHYLMLEVIDVRGRKAFSPSLWVYSYGEGHMRCGDNSNFQDTSVGVVWPSAEEMLPVSASTPRGIYEEMSRDGAGSLAPLPVCHNVPDTIALEGVGQYPKLAQGLVLDVRMASTNIVIDRMFMDKLSDYKSPDKAHPGWVNQDVADNEYFSRTHTSYFIRDRRDFNVIWGMRRPIEGTAAYEGNLIWNEGEIRFKKDCVLGADVPIPLVKMVCPRDKNRGLGGTMIALDAQKGQELLSHDDTKDLTVVGRLSGGGYVSQFPCGRWHPAFLAPAGSDFAYSAYFPKNWIDGEWSGDRLLVGLGSKGLAVKAGTVMKYRFAAGIFYDREDGQDGVDASKLLLNHAATALNLGGGHDGYQVKMEVGALDDAVFFCTVKAKASEAVFTLGPQNLLFDLPIKVEGLEDNGCAAVYSTVRKWFRFVPVLDGTAYFQEPIETANRMWVGNIFVCDNKDLKLTVVIDGLAKDAVPFVEVHNPTTQDVETTIASSPNTPQYGGMSMSIKVPAGASLRLNIADHRFEPVKE